MIYAGRNLDVLSLCECGCGKTAPVAKKTDNRFGHVKGRSVRFLAGHHRRHAVQSTESRAKISDARKGKFVNELHPRWKGEDAGYAAKHRWLHRHKERTGICQRCSASPDRDGRASTEFANISGNYLRDVNDYIELCSKCHRYLDAR